jgi:hypothetical protein
MPNSRRSSACSLRPSATCSLSITRTTHQSRPKSYVEMAREGVPLNVIQRQLGHANLGITSVYLQRIDNSEIIESTPDRGNITGGSDSRRRIFASRVSRLAAILGSCLRR